MNCVNYTFGETSGCAHDLSIKYTIFGQIQWGEAIWRLASFHNATPRLNLPERGMQTPIGTASDTGPYRTARITWRVRSR